MKLLLFLPFLPFISLYDLVTGQRRNGAVQAICDILTLLILSLELFIIHKL